MSSTMKLSLLALVSTVAAIPQAGGYGHSKFHSAVKASETQGAGYPVNTPAGYPVNTPAGYPVNTPAGYVPQSQGYATNPKPSSSAGYPAGYPVDNTPKPSSSAGYPVGYPVDNKGSKPAPSAGYPTGYPVGYNSTAPYPTGARPGSGYETKDITVDITKTSTTTIIKTVHVTPSPVGQQSAPAGNYATSPAAVGQAVPSAGNDQCGPATVTVTAKEVVTVTVGGNKNEPSSYVQAPPSKPTPAESKPVEYPVASSKPAESKPAEYPASTPKPAESKPAGYPVASSKPAEAVPYKADVPASSAAPSPAPSAGYTSSTGYSGAKRGLVYNDASLVKALSGSYKYGYAWNWGQTENNDIGVPFMPAIPRPAVASVEEWMANVDKAVKKGSKAVMGFNECDHKEQCNMEVVEACAAWKKYMNPIKEKYPDVYIVGPSVTNGPAPMGLDWLTRFHAACPDAKMDGTNIHFYSKYDDATNNQYSYTIDRFKLQVETAAKNYGKQVWVTEYGLNAGTATPEQAASFLKQTMEYMDGSANVAGYSYFKVGTDQSQYQLCSGTGPSALGKVYATS